MVKGACHNCGAMGHKAVACQAHQANAVEHSDVRDDMEVGGVWMIGAVGVDVKSKLKVHNMFHVLKPDVDDDVIEMCAIDEGRKLTRGSAMGFNVVDVKKPLASAVKVVRAGNRVVLEPEGNFIENLKTCERMEVGIENEIFMFDDEFQDGDGRGDYVGFKSGLQCLAED